MSTKEIVVNMLDTLTEEQLQGLMMLLKGYINKNQYESEAEDVQGILSKYANKTLISDEKKAWESAVKEKYENS